MIIKGSGVSGLWGNLKEHPECPHGPTLLFKRSVNKETKHFYACSACRDRKLCNFYLEKGQEISKNQKWTEELRKLSQSYNHRKCFLRFNQLLTEPKEKRAYCHTCERPMSLDESGKHQSHEITANLSEEQLNNPTTFLKPLSNVKKEAQYLFSEKATQEIVNMVVDLGAKSVLCIGAPRIHEFINQNYEQVSSLLLDIDGRYHNFFGPLSFCWYNLFNHHFFNNDTKNVFKDFLTQNNGKDIYLICDPPFGGRVEFISQTIITITDLHKKWNGLLTDDLKIIFIFPYFMESIMKYKSNPTGIHGGLKDLKMSDYKVNYDNHPLFITGPRGSQRKYGSPVRIFTNIALDLLKLPEDQGYKYCKRCSKWVSAENKHCKKCKSCTSKDGRRYRHCNKCERCVKPTWKHCKVCERCVLEKHTCGVKPQASGSLSKNDVINTSDIEDDYSIIEETDVEKFSLKSKVKRKRNVLSYSNGKRRKMQSNLNSEESGEDEVKNIEKDDSTVEDNVCKKRIFKPKLNGKKTSNSLTGKKIKILSDLDIINGKKENKKEANNNFAISLKAKKKNKNDTKNVKNNLHFKNKLKVKSLLKSQ